MFVYMPDKDCKFIWKTDISLIKKKNREKRTQSKCICRKKWKQTSFFICAPFLSSHLCGRSRRRNMFYHHYVVYALDFHLMVNSFVSPSQWFQTYHIHCISIRLSQQWQQQPKELFDFDPYTKIKSKKKTLAKESKKLKIEPICTVVCCMCVSVGLCGTINIFAYYFCICFCVWWHFPLLFNANTFIRYV